MRRTTVAMAVTVAVATVALGACGGDDDDAAVSTAAAVSTSSPSSAAASTSIAPSSTSEPAATTSAPASSTTTSAPAASPTSPPASTTTTTIAATTTAPQAPDGIEALAIAGNLAAADFTAPWTEFAPGGASTLDTTACAYTPDGPTTTIADGGAQYGPTMQFGDTGAFVSSATSVFPDGATAQAFLAIVNTDEWGTCRADQLEQVQADQGFPDIDVEVATRTSDVLGQQGFESYAQFNYTDAAGDLTRVVLISYYRLDEVVIRVVEEYGALTDEQITTFFDANYAALTAAYARVDALQG